MSDTASDILLDTIMDWGVDTIFGLPGDGINGIMEAFRKRKDRLRFIQVRHEESAAFMACAYAKYTGKLGVCLATSGPGGIHLLNGLYDAKCDGQPVLAITGLQFRDLLNTHGQQDVELDKLFEDVCVYNSRVMDPSHTENVAELACRTALSQRGVSHITMPVDVQLLPAKKHSARNVPHHVSNKYAHGVTLPDRTALENAAEILNAGNRVVMLVGRGAIHATDEIIAVSEKLNAPIIKALLGKAAVPDAHPSCLGGIGLLGTRPSQEALERCDTLLIVGTSFPYIEFYPKPGDARCVQMDVDPTRIGLRYPAETGLVCDSRAGLSVLLPLLNQKSDRKFLETAIEGKQKWDGLMESRGTHQGKPMKPQVVAHELGRRLKDNAIVSSDSGTITTWWARQIYARRGQMFSCSGNLATMACGLPYTIAAQIAHPDRQCVAFVGDGGFTMLMGEFVTAVKYKLPIKVIVIKNNTLGQIKWEQMVFLGNPEFGVELEPIDFAGFARVCGGIGYTIDDPRDCGRILDEAIANGKPTIIEAVVDPFEAPMPGKITVEQALHFAESLAKGEPYGGKIALTALSDKVRELI